jgi:signal peptidase
MNNKGTQKFAFKDIIKYITTVLSWTIFVLLVIIGILLIYYYISIKLYSTHGEKYEPKFSIYTIVSPSMEPTIKVYDVIINTRVDKIDDLKSNDVITFISTWEVTEGMTITHRVAGFKTLEDGSKCVVTRGDNNTSDDQACVKEQNIIGVTKAIIPGLGKVQFFLGSPLGWLLVIMLPLLYVTIKVLFYIFKKYRKPKIINKEEPLFTETKDNLNDYVNMFNNDDVLCIQKKDSLEEKYNYLLRIKNKNK